MRILNGSNARYYRFRFSDNRVFQKIATDGGFLNEPVPIREMVMLPGERNEIVVDFSDGGPAMLVGTVIALIQALTQIQEVTLTFVPQIIVFLLVVAVSASFIGAHLSTFTEMVYSRIERGF